MRNIEITDTIRMAAVNSTVAITSGSSSSELAIVDAKSKKSKSKLTKKELKEQENSTNNGEGDGGNEYSLVTIEAARQSYPELLKLQGSVFLSAGRCRWRYRWRHVFIYFYANNDL